MVGAFLKHDPYRSYIIVEKGKNMKEKLENIIKRLNGMQIVYSLGEYDVDSYMEALKEMQSELKKLLSKQYSAEVKNVLDEVEASIELLNDKNVSQRRMF